MTSSLVDDEKETPRDAREGADLVEVDLHRAIAAPPTDENSSGSTSDIKVVSFRNQPPLNGNSSSSGGTRTEAKQRVPETWSEMSGSHNWKWECSRKWTRGVNRLRHPVLSALQYVSNKAAKNPRWTITLVTVLSIALLLIGSVTNFTMEGDEDKLWTPKDSKADVHGTWVDENSGFPEVPRVFFMFFHHNGHNVLGKEQVGHIFELIEKVQALSGYDEMCSESLYINPQTNKTTCRIWGVTKFWESDKELFDKEDDTTAIATMSRVYFPDGSRVAAEDIYGFPIREEDGTLLTSVKSYSVGIEFPDTETAEEFEEKAIDVVLDYDEMLEANRTASLRAEISAYRSFGDEVTRAMVVDIPLLPAVFIIMSVFAMLVFVRRGIRSRSFLGFCGVLAVLLSLATGYGLMFLCGVVLTQMTQILPFIIFGIGLDDVFILTCSYDRTDRNKNPVERIHDTIDDTGMSIFMTSLTSILAFGLGCLSDIPAIYWLCLYGVPTIAIVFVYQLTFFVACMVLDEARIQAHRIDCCCCFTARGQGGQEEDQGSSRGFTETRVDSRDHFVDRIMSKYATFILHPKVKLVTVVLFLALTAGMAYSTSLQKQEFDPKDLMPSDSYLRDFWNAIDDYQARSGAMPFAYFRFVDQSSPEVQDDMKNYIDDLVKLDSIEEPPQFFWLNDFDVFVKASNEIQDLPFTEQLDAFLQVQRYFEMYNDHIVRNENGEVTASRCLLFMDNVDWDNVKDQIDALKDQRELTESQPVNQGRDDWAFFTYFEGYDIWELYRVSVEEIIQTAIIGVFAITCAALVLIPHWSAALVVFPLVVILYIDLMGFLQLCGVRINPISYIGLVMSIGLLVDFVMHVLLRYYESTGTRTEKTVYTLNTMGSAIFLGGTSSLLGTLPLAFSTSEMFFNIFIVFFGLVIMGTAHGLILMPVILSTVGPQDPAVNRLSVMAGHKATEAALKHVAAKEEDPEQWN